MALDRMSIISGGLWPTSPADFTERMEHVASRGLFTDFPGFVEEIISYVKQKWLTIFKALRRR